MDKNSFKKVGYNLVTNFFLIYKKSKKWANGRPFAMLVIPLFICFEILLIDKKIIKYYLIFQKTLAEIFGKFQFYTSNK